MHPLLNLMSTSTKSLASLLTQAAVHLIITPRPAFSQRRAEPRAGPNSRSCTLPCPITAKVSFSLLVSISFLLAELA
jgi:hypothetical protein